MLYTLHVTGSGLLFRHFASFFLGGTCKSASSTFGGVSFFCNVNQQPRTGLRCESTRRKIGYTLEQALVQRDHLKVEVQALVQRDHLKVEVQALVQRDHLKIEVDPQLSHNGHPEDGALVVAASTHQHTAERWMVSYRLP